MEATYIKAINSALHEEMRRDENVFVMGEDVADLGGAFKATEGLLDAFGEERVIDTPISEAGFTGLGVGAAMTGVSVATTGAGAAMTGAGAAVTGAAAAVLTAAIGAALTALRISAAGRVPTVNGGNSNPWMRSARRHSSTPSVQTRSSTRSLPSTASLHRAASAYGPSCRSPRRTNH